MNNRLNIHDRVISAQFGLGIIIAIEPVNGSLGDYYIIQSEVKNIKTFIPVEGNDQFRKLSSAATLHQFLDNMNMQFDASAKAYSNKRERIEYFKGRSRKQDIQNIFNTLIELRSIKDKGSVEKKIMDSLVETLVLEVQTVMQLGNDEASAMVNKSVVGF